MASALLNTFRLAKAGVVFARHGVRFVPAGMKVPLVLRAAQAAVAPIGWLSAPFRIGQPKAKRLSAALTRLGPSYVKLGQFLATRADVIGPELARDLSNLQDRLPPFSMREARAAIEQQLGGKLEDHFAEFGSPVAAASIAQVHKAVVIDKGVRREVAVKILRPNVEKRFKRDLDSYAFAAGIVDRWVPSARRLKPLAVVANLKRTTELEMDLRLEAAAISAALSAIGMPSIQSSVSTRFWVRRQSIEGTLNRPSSLVLSAISEIAAASSRRSISSSVVRLRLATTASGFRRRADGTQRSTMPAANA